MSRARSCEIIPARNGRRSTLVRGNENQALTVDAGGTPTRAIRDLCLKALRPQTGKSPRRGAKCGSRHGARQRRRAFGMPGQSPKFGRRSSPAPSIFPDAPTVTRKSFVKRPR